MTEPVQPPLFLTLHLGPHAPPPPPPMPMPLPPVPQAPPMPMLSQVELRNQRLRALAQYARRAQTAPATATGTPPLSEPPPLPPSPPVSNIVTLTDLARPTVVLPMPSMSSVTLLPPPSPEVLSLSLSLGGGSGSSARPVPVQRRRDASQDGVLFARAVRAFRIALIDLHLPDDYAAELERIGFDRGASAALPNDHVAMEFEIDSVHNLINAVIQRVIGMRFLVNSDDIIRRMQDRLRTENFFEGLIAQVVAGITPVYPLVLRMPPRRDPVPVVMHVAPPPPVVVAPAPPPPPRAPMVHVPFNPGVLDALDDYRQNMTNALLEMGRINRLRRDHALLIEETRALAAHVEVMQAGLGSATPDQLRQRDAVQLHCRREMVEALKLLAREPSEEMLRNVRRMNQVVLGKINGLATRSAPRVVVDRDAAEWANFEAQVQAGFNIYRGAGYTPATRGANNFRWYVPPPSVLRRIAALGGGNLTINGATYRIQNSLTAGVSLHRVVGGQLDYIFHL